MSVNAPSFKSQAILDDVDTADTRALVVNDAVMDSIIDELAGYLVPTLRVQNVYFDSKGMVDFTFVPSYNVNIKNGLIDFYAINGGRIETRFITGENLTLANNFSVGNVAAGSSLVYNNETGILAQGTARLTGPLFLGDVNGRVLRAFATRRVPIVAEDVYLTSIVERQNMLPFVQFLDHDVAQGTTSIVFRNEWPFVIGPRKGDWILVEYTGFTSKLVAQVTQSLEFGDTELKIDGNLMLNFDDPTQYIAPGRISWISAPHLWGESGSVYQFAPLLYTGKTLGVGTMTPNVTVDIVGSDAVQLPKGTVGERPLAINSGYLRYNSQTQRFEGTTEVEANNNVWTEFVTIRDLTRTGQVNVGSSNVPNTTFVILGDNAKIGISMSSPNVTLDMAATDAIHLPVGTTEQRPTTFYPSDIGYIRFNSSNQRAEISRRVDPQSNIEWNHILHEQDLTSLQANIYSNVHLWLDDLEQHIYADIATASGSLVNAIVALETNIFTQLSNTAQALASSIAGVEANANAQLQSTANDLYGELANVRTSIALVESNAASNLVTTASALSTQIAWVQSNLASNVALLTSQVTLLSSQLTIVESNVSANIAATADQLTAYVHGLISNISVNGVPIGNISDCCETLEAKLSIVEANLAATAANLTAYVDQLVGNLASNGIGSNANGTVECCRSLEARLFDPPPAPTLVEILPSSARVEIRILPPPQVELAFLNTFVPYLRELQYQLIFPDGSTSSGAASVLADQTRTLQTIYLMTGAPPAGTSGLLPSTDGRIQAYYSAGSVYLYSIQPTQVYGLNLFYKNEVDQQPSPMLSLTNMATLSAGVPGAPVMLSGSTTVNTATVVVQAPADHDSATEGDNALPYLQDYRYTFAPISTSRYGGLASNTIVDLIGPTHPTQGDAPATATGLGPLWPGTTYEVTSAVRNYLNPLYGPVSNNVLTLTTSVPPPPARLTTAQGGMSPSTAQSLQYSVSGNTSTLAHQSLDGATQYTGIYLVQESKLQAQANVLLSRFVSARSLLISGSTADPASYVRVESVSGAGTETAQVSLAGFGGVNQTGIGANSVSASVRVQVTQDVDSYSGITGYTGFWKQVSAEVRLPTPSQFPRSSETYAVQLSIQHEIDQSVDVARRIEFHVDGLTSTPTVTDMLYWTPNVTAISGIPTVSTSFSVRFHFQVQELASYFLPADGIHARFTGPGLSATLGRQQMTGVVPWIYRNGENGYTVSTVDYGGVLPAQHPKLQFHDLPYLVNLPTTLYTNNLTYQLSASNLMGTSTVHTVPYGDPNADGVYLWNAGPSIARADIPALTYERASADPSSILSLSLAQYPTYTSGSINAVMMDAAIRANVGNVLLTAGQHVRSGLAAANSALYDVMVQPTSNVWTDRTCGGVYDHLQTIVDENVRDLPFVLGKFRTAQNATVNNLPFLDYRTYFDSRVTRYDYRSLHSETEMRWTTFLCQNLRQDNGTALVSTAKYAGVRIYLDGMEGVWELDPAAQPTDHACWIRVYNDISLTTPLTAWLNATLPYIGSWTVERANTMGSPCLNPSYVNTAAARHCFVHNLTPASAVLLVRIGLTMTDNKAFRALRVSAVNIF